MTGDRLVRQFKDEAVAVYSIEEARDLRAGASKAPGTAATLLGAASELPDNFQRYVVSTRSTRDLMNYPEIINCDFTNLMQNGITNALKGINILERISGINSRGVNVYHLLRGGINFRVTDALKKAFGYKWHSSSYLSSQRVLKDGKYEISDDTYRKFVVPDNATVYTADIVASGVSIDNGIEYIYQYMSSTGHRLRNFFFITIGCEEAEKALLKWHRRFEEAFPDYERTMVIYLEGRFGLATDKTPFANKIPFTDLVKSYKEGALLTPEFEHSQFDRVITAMEACAIYDGGKKGFEPINHLKDILEFWENQMETAGRENWSIWDEYNRRFPLDPYLSDIESRSMGSPEVLAEHKAPVWEGIEPEEYVRLFGRFRWLWSDERIARAIIPGSFLDVAEKKVKYVRSLISDTV